MNICYYEDPEIGQPHIYNHHISKKLPQKMMLLLKIELKQQWKFQFSLFQPCGNLSQNISHLNRARQRRWKSAREGYRDEKNEVLALTHSSSASAFSFLPLFCAFAPACEANTFRRSVNLSYCAVSICE